MSKMNSESDTSVEEMEANDSAVVCDLSASSLDSSVQNHDHKVESFIKLNETTSSVNDSGLSEDADHAVQIKTSINSSSEDGVSVKKPEEDGDGKCVCDPVLLASDNKEDNMYERLMEEMVVKDMEERPPNPIAANATEEQMKAEDCASKTEAHEEDNSRAGTSATEDDTTSEQPEPDANISEPPLPSPHSSSDEMDEAIELIMRRRRHHRRRLDSDSSSSSSSSEDETSSTATRVESSDDNETELVCDNDSLPRPSDSWRPVHTLFKRELGQGSGGVHQWSQLPHVFRDQCGASLNLVQRLERQKCLDYHKGCVNALHFNRSGTLLASGSDDLEIAVWDLRKDKPFFTFESGHHSNVFQCKFLPFSGDAHLVSCARDGQVRLAELSATGVCKGTKKVAQHRGSAHKLALLEDTSHEFYSCGEDGVIFQIDVREQKPTRLCTAKDGTRKIALYSIHTNPVRSYELCTGGRDQYIRVFDKRMVDDSGECTVKKFCPHHLVESEHKANVTCAVYNWNGTEVLGTYNDEDIYMFDNNMSEGAEYIHKYRGHRNNATVKGVNYYGPHSEYIVSGSDCGNVFLWERNTERIVQFMHADEGGVVNVLEPHPHMPLLATSGLDNDVKIFAPTAKEPTKLKGLAKRMRRNAAEREEARRADPDPMDSRMLWFLLQHLRRGQRPDGGEDEDAHSDPDSDPRDSDDNDDHSDSDASDGRGNPVECLTS